MVVCAARRYKSEDLNIRCFSARRRFSIEGTLTSENEEIEILTKLGLTSCQARIYSALVRSGACSATKISRVSGVTRENVYRITPTLQKLGLVEKIIDTPCRFRATPIDEGLAMLLKNRVDEVQEEQAKIAELLANFRDSNERPKLDKDGSQFIMIPPQERTLSMLDKLLDKAQTSVTSIFTSKEFIREWCLRSVELSDKALGRGVEFRFIIEKPESKELFHEITKNFRKNSSWEVRYVLNPPSVVFAMFDEKEVVISTSAVSPITSPALWSNNASILAVIRDYFERMWLTSLEDERTIDPAIPSSECRSQPPHRQKLLSR
jgi:sugar-specific transcriptional regulator TrmB